MGMQIKIMTGSIEECIRISSLIPEFTGTCYNQKEYENRLLDKHHLILIAYSDGTPAGFKVGYDRDNNGTFYSWMRGVIPIFRKEGVAKALAKEQEHILIENGYKAVEYKTRNYLKPMIIFGLKNGFDIINMIIKEKADQH